MNFKGYILAVSAIALLAVSPAFAQNRVATSYPVVNVDATAGSTFATTTYADLPAATVSFTPHVDPNATEAPGTPAVKDVIIVEFNADVQKATATTGICAAFVNGAIVAKTARTIDFAAKEGTMTIISAINNTTTGAQTIKIQCKSGDTNVFTVNTGILRVVESF